MTRRAMGLELWVVGIRLANPHCNAKPTAALNQDCAYEVLPHKHGGWPPPPPKKNGEKGGPGGRSVDGCLLWFLYSSQTY